MRLKCPQCGERDRREFYYGGVVLDRPAADAGADAWDDYVHVRDNLAGRTVDFWMHEAGCGAWLRVERDTVTHTIYAVSEVTP